MGSDKTINRICVSFAGSHLNGFVSNNNSFSPLVPTFRVYYPLYVPQFPPTARVLVPPQAVQENSSLVLCRILDFRRSRLVRMIWTWFCMGTPSARQRINTTGMHCLGFDPGISVMVCKLKIVIDKTRYSQLSIPRNQSLCQSTEISK